MKLISRFVLCGIASVLAFSQAAFVEAAGTSSGKTRTVVWQGNVQIRKTYRVPKGMTLEIRPGSRIVFSKGSGLMVKGALKAVGVQGKEIIFTGSRKEGAGSWDEIRFESASDSIMERCIIEHATWGIQSHVTRLNLIRCTFRNGEGGIRFRSGPVAISKCLFTGNKIGIRSYKGVAAISECDFTGNDVGIFVREKGNGLNIARSNLFGNGSYNIRMGDFNDEDVRAPGNWWGGADPAATIFDAAREPGIGRVLFEPFSAERISWQ